MINRYRFLSASVIYRMMFTALMVCITSIVSGQSILWFEDFGTSTICDRGTLSSAASGTLNGPWTITDIGTQEAFANTFYISATERGKIVNDCSEAGCPGNSNTDRNLHVGSIAGAPTTVYCVGGDCGAVYDPGFTTLTDRRAESPVIDLTGQTNLVLTFKYIYKGDQGANDYVTVECNTGSGWVNISTPTVSPTGCTGVPGNPAIWTQLTIALPLAANNNPNVQIGFRWRNNSDVTGLDQSFAVDSIIIGSLSAPVAGFTADQQIICNSQCVNFMADTSALITSYSWSFPGGTPGSSSVTNPTVCYANAGTYDVQLIVSGPAGIDTLREANYIQVNPCAPPIADFTVSDSVTCERSCVTFADMSSNASSWRWFFPGGTPSIDTVSGPNPPQVCYQTPGTYNVILIVSNQFGSDTLVKPAYMNISVCPLPIADYTSTITRLCPQHCVSFTGTDSLQVTQWHWYFPGATPDTASGRNPVVCYTREGLYDVQLIVENQYGSDTIIRYSDVNVSFVQNATVSPDTTMQYGSEYQMEATGGLTYVWSPSLGLDSIYSQTPIASPTNTTTYVVLITDTGGCSVTRQVTVTILHDNKYFIPTAFSPNGDGNNDYLFVRGNNLYGVRFTIFDRWGEMVFETTDALIPWDGNYKGKELDPGVYTWVLTINFEDKKGTTATGSVTLVR